LEEGGEGLSLPVLQEMKKNQMLENWCHLIIFELFFLKTFFCSDFIRMKITPSWLNMKKMKEIKKI
jgi:hypothetical protein